MSANDAGPVIVCGAGAAGLAAALAAARAGAPVVLVETRASLGGTVAHTLLHTLGGLYDSAGTLLNEGLPAELIGRLQRLDKRVVPRRMGRLWVLQVCPDLYQLAVQRWLAEESRIVVWSNARVQNVKTINCRVAELEVRSGDGVMRLKPRAVIDATGSAEIVRLVDPVLVKDDSPRASGGFVARLRGVVPGTMAFPRGVGVARQIRAAVEERKLPRECVQAWLDVGFHEDEAYLKLAVRVPDDWREQGDLITEAAARQAAAIVDFLRQMPGFAAVRMERLGELGVRDGGRAIGECQITADDVRQARKFAGAACRCAWPIEYWHPEQGLQMEYLPDGAFYEIPLQALKVRGVANLWVAGKCLSADCLAQASARVVGSCWAMGEAAGLAAATGAKGHAIQPL